MTINEQNRYLRKILTILFNYTSSIEEENLRLLDILHNRLKVKTLNKTRAKKKAR